MCLPATLLHQTSALAHVEVADPLNTTTARITAITSCCERVFTQTTTPSRQSGIIDHGSRSAKQVSPLLFVVHNFAGCRPQRLVNDIPRSRRLVCFLPSGRTGLLAWIFAIGCLHMKSSKLPYCFLLYRARRWLRWAQMLRERMDSAALPIEFYRQGIPPRRH